MIRHPHDERNSKHVARRDRDTSTTAAVRGERVSIAQGATIAFVSLSSTKTVNSTNNSKKTRPYLQTVDIVVADGGSTDGSTHRDKLESLGVNNLLVKKGAGKLGAQMRMAFAWALDRGYQGVICIDGNGKDGPDAIPSFVQKREEKFDHVQGSRFIPGGLSENLPFSRWLGVKFLHAPLISLASHHRYTDTTNGFRGYSRRILEDPRIAVFRDIFSGYELQYYLAIRSSRLRFKVCEIPVTRRYPADGTVPTKISPIRGNLQVLKCLFAAC